MAAKSNTTTFNTRSWHYRFNNWVLHNSYNFGERPRNICPYFWGTVLRIIALPIILLGRTAVSLSTLWGGHRARCVSDDAFFGVMAIMGGIILVGLVALSIADPLRAAIVLGLVAGGLLVGRLIGGGKKHDGLLMSKIKSFYENSCFGIEWVEDENVEDENVEDENN